MAKPVQRFSNTQAGSEPFAKFSTLLLFSTGYKSVDLIRSAWKRFVLIVQPSQFHYGAALCAEDQWLGKGFEEWAEEECLSASPVTTGGAEKIGEVFSQANCASESIGPCSAFCVPGRAKKDDHRRELHPYHQTDRRGQPAVDGSILCLPNVKFQTVD
jgi:hypothetical protein